MADTKSSAKTPNTGVAPQQGASPSLGQRVAGFFFPRSSGPGLRKQTSSTTRFIVGSVTFILVAEVLTYLVDYANLQFKLNLNQPIFGASAGWLTWFFLINVVLILGLWILLNRLGFFPRDMWSASRNTTTRGSSSSNGNGGGNKKNNASQIPGIGKPHTRAERRYTAATAAAKNANGKGRTATSDDAYSTEHDEAYDRAKAAQRQRKRRALR